MTREQLEISRQYLNSIDPKRDISCIVDRKIKNQTYDLAVIMPCYNVEKYVEEAVDSILHQETNFKVELIIVNDGSTDSTGEIVNHYGDLDDVLVIHQENKGLSAARNTGLFYADARYLCFIDSDDYMTDGALDLLLDVAFENNADIVQGIMQSFSDGKEEFGKESFTGRIEKMGKAEMAGYACGKVFKAQLFDDLAFPEGYLFEDGIITYLVAPKAKNIYLLDAFVYAYRQNESGITKKSQANIRSIDAYWLREIFFEDMERLGIEIDQPMYEQILDEIALTFVRTNDLELNVKVSIFFLTTEWFGKLHERFSTDNKYKSVLEKGMELESFQTYSDGCAILWNKRLVGE